MIMALKSSQYDLEDFSDSKLKSKTFYQGSDISPWYEQAQEPMRKQPAPRPKVKSNQEIVVKNFNKDHIQAISKQSLNRRKCFRATMPKFQPIKQQNQQPLQQQKSAQDICILEQQTDHRLQPFLKTTKGLTNEHQLRQLSKKVLNTTMYLYECREKPRRMSIQTRNTSIDSDMQNLTARTTLYTDKDVTKGTHNLQRILRMKQRLRIKNSCLVKQIKEKQLKSSKQISVRNLVQGQSFRNDSWKSSTLQVKSRNICENFQSIPDLKINKSTRNHKINPIFYETTHNNLQEAHFLGHLPRTHKHKF